MAGSQPKVIILTGASRGIGQAIAHYLLSHSHKVILISRTQSSLNELQKQYSSELVDIIAGDLSTDAEALASKAVEAANAKWGRIDALIINHGTLDPVQKVADAGVEAWRQGFETNVFSAVNMIQASLPSLRKSHGRIIFTSSGAAISAYQGWGCYGAGKAVLNHLALTLAAEEPDVTTVSIRPGVVDTEMQREIREVHHATMSEKDGKKFRGLKADGGLLAPEQPGHVIAKLAVSASGKEVSGKFLSWNDEALREFQGD